MLKPISSKIFFTAAIASLALTGCGDSDEKSGNKADLSAAGEFLQYVPADSPYVMANLAPLPDDVMDKLEPTLDRILSSYQIAVRELAVAAANNPADGDVDPEAVKKATAVIGELSSLLSMDGLRGAGIEAESRFAVYGNGLLPVMRFEVSDGALFEAALVRMEESAGEEMDVTEIAGNAVRYVLADEVKILIAVLDTQVVMSMAPPSFNDEQLSELLGFSKPASSIVDSGKLQDIVDEYGFMEYFVGYLDVVSLANTVTGEANGLDADIFSTFGDQNDLSEVCRDEIRSMAAVMPRMVMGYTNISTERFDSQVVVEMRKDIAEGMTTLAAPVPGLMGDMGGLLSFGMSLDVKALQGFVETQLDAIEENPYLCEDFADIQAGAAQARMTLQQPVMPMVYDFRGFVAVLENIEGLDMTTKAPPTAIDGQFLFAMDDAPALISLGAMFSPELASLDLQPDGKAVLLDVPQAQMAGSDVYVALNDDALAMSIGDGMQSKLGAMLEEEAGDTGTFFNFSMDAHRYYKFMGEAIAQSEASEDDPMTPEFQAAIQDVMLAVADMYDRMTVDMRFTEKGVVIDSIVTLAE